MVKADDSDGDVFLVEMGAIKARNAALTSCMSHAIHELRQVLQAFRFIRDMLGDDMGPEKLSRIQNQLDQSLISASGVLDAMGEAARAKREQGAALGISLPLLKTSADEAPPEAAALSSGKGGEGENQPRLYIIEDNVQVGGAMRELLESYGYVVETFVNGAVFFEAHGPADEGCVLVDAIMPVMSGWEIIERLKAEKYAVRAVMMTGSGDVPMAVRAMKAGAADFIEKPVGAQELVACIQNALGEKASAEAGRQGQDVVTARFAMLTQRQRQILTLLLNGASNKSIATELKLSQRTVESHRAAIMKKTGTRSLAALVRWAITAR